MQYKTIYTLFAFITILLFNSCEDIGLSGDLKQLKKIEGTYIGKFGSETYTKYEMSVAREEVVVSINESDVSFSLDSWEHNIPFNSNLKFEQYYSADEKYGITGKFEITDSEVILTFTSYGKHGGKNYNNSYKGYIEL